ncbi:TetR family transcriptional regulator [Actinoplanes sp. NPDC048796]|uniref:TetR family transcriptional regulator n=1 Tax=unclassified Actinoplanes TaxID=2626549 RepID=UPI0033F05F20
MTPSPGVPLGLRERKKARTRAAIRGAAMRLFEEQGYAATTVEQIAEAAEVSPSTFFRYFPTKEDTVLTDDYDPLIVEAIRAQPVEVPAVRAVLLGMRGVFENLTEQEWSVERRRQRLIETVPELRVRQQQQTVAAVDMLADAIAERDGRPADENARVVAGALVGIVLAVSPPGAGFQPHDFDRLELALAALKNSLKDF